MTAQSLSSRRKAAVAFLVACFTPCLALSQAPPLFEPVDGGPYVPTPQQVVERMLELAKVAPGDTVYDLGSGDGRLVIEAARRHGARGVGVERDAALVERSRAAAAEARVADRVRFIRGDIFETDLRQASVVTLYLLPVMMQRLSPKLRQELPAGARVVSHDFPLEGWPEEQMVQFESEEKEQALGSGATQLFLYRAPGPAPAATR
ncbi:MAG: methyltransferase domain-containing protein [Betaproteobacteria bacterium]|nr:methyltransferase domain-containing protein [Betaproteobacteria bacterium]